MFSEDPQDNIIFMFEKGVRFIKRSSKEKSELLQGKGSRFSVFVLSSCRFGERDRIAENWSKILAVTDTK